MKIEKLGRIPIRVTEKCILQVVGLHVRRTQKVGGQAVAGDWASMLEPVNYRYDACVASVSSGTGDPRVKKKCTKVYD